MPQPSYVYGVARVSVLETRLLSRDRIERMVDAPSAADVFKVLSETEYGMAAAELDSPYEYETLLSTEIRKVKHLIYEVTPDPEITDLFFLKHDIHNIKVELKAQYMGVGEKSPLTEFGTIPNGVIKEAVKDKDYRALPEFIAEAIERIDDLFILKPDPQKIDLYLDRAMYDYIFSVCKKSKHSFVLNYFLKLVDLINLRSLLRTKKIGEDFGFLKEVLIPHGNLKEDFYSEAVEEPIEQLTAKLSGTDYGRLAAEGIQAFIRSDNLTIFERLVDNYLLDFAKTGKKNYFGIEPIVGYLLAKENEIKLIRIIMAGKINGISSEKIRERLRDVYV